MGARFNKTFVQLSLGVLLVGATGTASFAVEPAAASVNMNDLALLENRYFSQAYTHDPVEKRLERLECLVYGSSREGSTAERLGRLQKTVATRSQQPIAQEKGATAITSSKDKDAKPPQTSKQYPILNTLEWKTLKKTFPEESLDQRLGRLESKMFGQPAETMAYADRVERLKKVVGIGMNLNPNDGITATGPMPKARRGETDGFEVPLDSPIAGAPDLDSTMPDFGLMAPFSNLFGDTSFGGMQKQMQQQMQQMTQLLRSMQDPRNQQQMQIPGGTVRSFSKSFTLDPKTGKFIEQQGHGNMPPNLMPQIQIQNSAPQESGQLKEVPGYADPNSI